MAVRSILVLFLVAACVQANQSPIDLVPSRAAQAQLKPLSFKDYHLSTSTYFLENTGHGCEITLQNSKKRVPTLKGGGLPRTFYLQQAHFHWGKTDTRGSEHALGGKAFSMEAHLVHWNSKYRNFSEAVSKPDGLAVVGFFLECADCPMSPSRRHRLLCSDAVRQERPWLLGPLCKASPRAWWLASGLMHRFLSPDVNQRIRSGLFAKGLDGYENSAFQKVVDEVPLVETRGSAKVKAKTDLLAWVVPHLKSSGYFTYKGSLTTSPFTENVIWTVYRDPIPIGKSQIHPFRDIQGSDGKPLLTNFRELQDNSKVEVEFVA